MTEKVVHKEKHKLTPKSNMEPIKIYVNDPEMEVKLFPGIVHGKREKKDIHAIVLHQTGGSTAESTFSTYKTQPCGAHYLVDKTGKIYQTAELTDITYHVGQIRSKCNERGTCSKEEKKKIGSILDNKNLKYTTEKVPKIHEHEKAKDYPDRYPVNNDSIGIEFVGESIGGIYVSITPEQQKSTDFLIEYLREELNLTSDDIYRHPDVSYKNETEAQSITW